MPSEPEVHFIDTNVFVYAASVPMDGDGELADLRAGSRRVVEELAEGRIRGVTSITVLQEVMYLLARWARQRQEPRLHQVAQRLARSTMALVDEVLAPTSLEFARAVEAYSQGRDINDLLIAETMLVRGIPVVISADRGLERLGLRRRDPREWV